MEWIGFGNGIYWNGVAMDLKGMEWNILEWKVMDTFGVGGLPSCWTRISAVCATANRLILSAS